MGENHLTREQISDRLAEVGYVADRDLGVVVKLVAAGRVLQRRFAEMMRPRTLAMRDTPEFSRYCREILDLFLARGVLREH